MLPNRVFIWLDQFRSLCWITSAKLILSGLKSRFSAVLRVVVLAVLSICGVAWSDDKGYDPCEHNVEDTFWDRSHAALSQGVCWPSRWVDSFFSPDDSFDGQPGTLVRLIGGHGWRDDGTSFSDSQVKARVVLPGTEERLSLIFTGDEDQLEDNTELGRDPSRERDQSGFQSALRWAARNSRRINLDADVGIRSGFNSFTRLRYRYRKPLSDHGLWFRFTQEGVWETDRGWRLVSTTEFDRPLTDQVKGRLSASATWSEQNIDDNRGVFVNQGAALFVQFNPRAGATIYSNVESVTRPQHRVEAYRMGARYRHSVWRKWFFYELEPFVNWPKENDYQPISGIVLRLEIQMGMAPEW